ncbi:MAG: hypothetical protein IRY99_03320 [Isosphaeraceae bacterium]|nr:hypothetical protein [Isosphaeraceae bacterium]
MLVLRRKDGQWVEITHRSGDVLRFRVYNLHSQPGQAHLAFDDEAHHFTIQRPERPHARPAPGALAPEACSPSSP